MRAATKLPLDVHLMIVEPERYLEDFAAAGADRLSVHVEACPHLHRTLQHIRQLGQARGGGAQPVPRTEDTIEYAIEVGSTSSSS